MDGGWRHAEDWMPHPPEPNFCPRCLEFRGALLHGQVQFLDPLRGANALSRRDSDQWICRLCAKAEALADIVGGMTDEMARVAIEADRQEVERLQYAGRWGTGFYTLGLAPLEDDYGLD
jgi:hypothetical protein